MYVRFCPSFLSCLFAPMSCACCVCFCVWGGCWEMLFVAEVRRRLALGFYVPPTPSLFAAAAVVLVVVVVVVVSVPCFNALPPRAVARTGPSAPSRLLFKTLCPLGLALSPVPLPCFVGFRAVFCWWRGEGAVLAKGLIPLDTWPCLLVVRHGVFSLGLVLWWPRGFWKHEHRKRSSKSGKSIRGTPGRGWT